MKIKPEAGGVHSTPVPVHLPVVGCKLSLELFTSQEWSLYMIASVQKAKKADLLLWDTEQFLVLRLQGDFFFPYMFVKSEEF